MESTSHDNDVPKTVSTQKELRGKRLLGLGRFPPEASLGRTVKVSVRSLHPILTGSNDEEFTILASLHMASTRKIAEDALLHSLGMYVNVTYLITSNSSNTLFSSLISIDRRYPC